MSETILQLICDLIQEDIGNRGLRTDPTSNLITATAGDFEASCRSLAMTEHPEIAIVTGFYIPNAQPPCAETDGPLGALFLARALSPLGIRVVLATDSFCIRPLKMGLQACGLHPSVPLIALPEPNHPTSLAATSLDYCQSLIDKAGPLTHLIALERVGPNHFPETLDMQLGPADEAIGEHFDRIVPPERHNRCHTMRGLDVTACMSPAHRLFEFAARHEPPITTIGIGDGGNEIGMGKIPWDIIRRNVPNGGLVACRVPTDHLIVSGVSNWGAYGLAAGVALLGGQRPQPELFDVERERELLRIMVEQGPLVDGVTGQPTVSVDGLPFESYSAPLRRIGELLDR